jgi:uncharacterized protein (TIGR02246 family)
MDAFDVMMVALKFNEKINARDLEGLVELMTEDHTFVDGSGEVHKGKDVMKDGWQDFFASYPDYRNIFTRVQVDKDFVVMVGYSTCSYEPLDGPALWSAKVRERRIFEWRVYEDTDQNRRNLKIMV